MLRLFGARRGGASSAVADKRPGGWFLLFWLAANTLGWALAWFLLETVFANGDRSSVWAAALPIGGALMGLAQYVALRRHVGIGSWWIVPGAVAWLAGSVAILMAMALVDARIMPALSNAILARTGDLARAEYEAGAAFGAVSGALTGMVLGAVVGIGQWLVLRLSLRRGAIWVLVSIATWAIAWAAYWGASVVQVGGENQLLTWGAASLLSGVAASAVSGLPLLWLLRRVAAGSLAEWQPAGLATVAAH